MHLSLSSVPHSFQKSSMSDMRLLLPSMKKVLVQVVRDITDACIFVLGRGGVMILCLLLRERNSNIQKKIKKKKLRRCKELVDHIFDHRHIVPNVLLCILGKLHCAMSTRGRGILCQKLVVHRDHDLVDILQNHGS